MKALESLSHSSHCLPQSFTCFKSLVVLDNHSTQINSVQRACSLIQDISVPEGFPQITLSVQPCFLTSCGENQRADHRKGLHLTSHVYIPRDVFLPHINLFGLQYLQSSLVIIKFLKAVSPSFNDFIFTIRLTQNMLAKD